MDYKNWYASRTIWFAVVYAIAAWGPAVLAAVGYGEWVPPESLVEWLGLLTPVVVAVLRKVTTRPIA